MSTSPSNRRRWRLLPRRDRRHAEAEARAEVELYIDLRIEELIQEGLSPEQADEQARAVFGDRETIVDECVDIAAHSYWRRRREETMGSIIRDVRFAVRTLRRAPRLVAAVCLTLALGIGVNSAIFSVVNAVVLQPLAYPEAERLFQIWTQYPEQGDFEFDVSNAEYLDYAAESELFETVAAYAVFSRVLTEQGQPRALSTAFATAQVWDVFGGRAALGRLFNSADDRPDAPSVTVLSYALWQTVFGANEQVVGQTIVLNGNESTIVGVAQPEFLLPESPADLYVPLGISREVITERHGHYLTVVGRALPDTTLERVRAEMATVTQRWIASYDHAHPLDAEPLQQEVVGDSGFALVVILGAVAAVLLIACANVAGLMLTRSFERHREMAIRTAIGASRGALARQLLVEGLLLALAGGALGLLLATVALPLLLQLEPGDLPRLGEVRIDGTVVAFTMVLSALCGVIFTVVPALRVSSLDPNRALAGGGRSSADASRQRFLRGIVLAEVALALVLVTGAGLLTKSLGRILDVDPGLQSEGILTARVALPSSTYDTPATIRQFYDDLQREIGGIPGVEAVGGVRRLPLAENAFMEIFVKEGESEESPEARNRFEYQMVTPGYFDAVGVEVISGRAFDTNDSPDTPRVAILNEALVKRYFAGEDPIGQHIRILASRPSTEPFLIVGVTRDVLQDGLDTEARAQIYVAHAQATEYFTGATRATAITVRGQGAPEALAESVRAAIARLDPDLAVTDTSTMEAIVWNSMARPRFLAILLGLLAGLSLLLAAIGVYSVVSYGVAQRTREFGVRMALGAQPGQVVRMVVAQGSQPAMAGAAIGLVVALMVARTLAGLLFQTNPYDPLTLGTVATVLLLVAALASWLPARRVVRLTTVDALKAE